MMKMKKTITKIIFTLITVSACTDTKLPKYVELRDLRILAMVADKPEVGPGDSVIITPVISDITETTSLTYEAFGCVDPGISQGASPTCAGNPTKTDLAKGTILPSSNSEMASNFTGNAPSFTVTIPPTQVIFAERSEIDKYNGVSYVINYNLTDSSGAYVSSIKRLIVSTKATGDRNLNPNITSILSNDIPLGSNDYPLNGRFKIQVQLGTDALLNYPYQKSDGSIETRSEELSTTWFITDGELKYYRSINSEGNEFTAPENLSLEHKNFLISVTRDFRGGETVKRICGGCN